MFDIVVHEEKARVAATNLSKNFRAFSGIFGFRRGEVPEFYLVRSNGEMEVRKYCHLNMASISIPLSDHSSTAKSSAHQALNSYRLGCISLTERIDRAAAIWQEETTFENGEYFLTISMIMPKKFNQKTAPEPNDCRIALHHRPSQMVACRRFVGTADEQKIHKYSAELRVWLSQYFSYRPEPQLKLTFYNPPQTLSFLRTNEVHIDVRTVN